MRLDPLDRRKRWRVDLPKLGAQLFYGALADLLAHHSPVRRDTEQHLPAALVQEGTDGHSGLSARAGSLLELQRLRLPGCGRIFDLIKRHRSPASLDLTIGEDMLLWCLEGPP